MSSQNSKNRNRGGARARKKNWNNSSKAKTAQKKSKTYTDYNFYVGSSTQASDFETSWKFLLNYIREKYTQDIYMALSKLEEVDFDKDKPTLVLEKTEKQEMKDGKPTSNLIKDEDAVIRNEAAKFEFQTEMKSHLSRKEKFSQKKILLTFPT